MARAIDGQRFAYDALEVVAGHRLVDREEPEHPVVVLAQVGLGLLGRPVLGDRRDREERLLALVERTRRIEHRAAEGAHEDRRPADLERLVGEAHDRTVHHEVLDPDHLVAAELEDVVRLRVGRRDGVEHLADRGTVGRLEVGRVRRRGDRQRSVGQPGRPEVARQPDHLGADGVVLALRPVRDLVRRHLALQRVPQLLREERATQPALALAVRQDDIPKMHFERANGRARRPGGRLKSRADRRHPRIVSGPRRVGESVPDQLIDPGQLAQGRFGVQPRHRPPGVADEIGTRRLQHRGHPFEPAGHGCESVGERGEFARKQREDAAAEDVDPRQRIPGVLAQPRLGESSGVELHQDQVAIHPLVGRQLGVAEPGHAARPFVVEGKPGEASLARNIGPFAVVIVVAGRRGQERVDDEQLAEELLETVAESSHRGSVSRAVPAPVDCAPRRVGSAPPGEGPRVVTLCGANGDAA